MGCCTSNDLRSEPQQRGSSSSRSSQGNRESTSSLNLHDLVKPLATNNNAAGSAITLTSSYNSSSSSATAGRGGATTTTTMTSSSSSKPASTTTSWLDSIVSTSPSQKSNTTAAATTTWNSSASASTSSSAAKGGNNNNNSSSPSRVWTSDDIERYFARKPVPDAKEQRAKLQRVPAPYRTATKHHACDNCRLCQVIIEFTKNMPPFERPRGASPKKSSGSSNPQKSPQRTGGSSGGLQIDDSFSMSRGCFSQASSAGFAGGVSNTSMTGKRRSIPIAGNNDFDDL